MFLTVEKLQKDLDLLKMRQVEALQNMHQIIGAISILEQLVQANKDAAAELSCEEVIELDHEVNQCP